MGGSFHVPDPSAQLLGIQVNQDIGEDIQDPGWATVLESFLLLSSVSLSLLVMDIIFLRSESRR